MKVLVISHNSFSKTSNNGKTLEAIFSAFSSAQLAQLYFSNLESPDFDYCSNYFKVTDMDVLKSLLMLRSPTVGGSADRVGLKSAGAGKGFHLLKRLFKRSNLLRDALWKTGRWRSESLFSWLRQFNPDVIFYLGGGASFSHRIAVEVKGYLNKPLVTYFTDDYIIYPEVSGLAGRLHHRFLKSAYDSTIRQSSLLFVIGEEMATKYSAHFSRDFDYIMNSVEDCEYVPPSQKNERLQVSYFGGLHLGRWKMIARFARALDGRVDVNVYSASELEGEMREAFLAAGVHFRGAVGADEIQSKMLSSDMLLHVESDESEYKALTRLSVSTKIPEYLISGRPVVAYGPRDLASMKVIIQNDIGVFISSDLSDRDIFNSLSEMTADAGTRRRCGLKAYGYAKDNFLKEVVAARFKEKLQLLAN